MTQSVYLNGRTVGRVQTEQQGLYYKIGCRCQLPDGQLYCLKATCGKQVKELGVCVPMGDCFGIDTAVPVKQIGEGEIQFEIACKHQHPTEEIFPVYEDVVFDYLHELPKARLRIQKGIVGITIQSDLRA